MARAGNVWRNFADFNFLDMKKTLFIVTVSFALFTTASAQTGIEKRDGLPSSSILDFATGTTKGIILPAVENLPATPANGTFLFDRNDARIKMYQNGAWVNLSNPGSTAGLVPYSGTVDNAKQTVMGSRSTAAGGVLVLEATDKALVLPKVTNPHLTVKSPYAGMMCYDTVSKSLAVFDGTVWNYWK